MIGSGAAKTTIAYLVECCGQTFMFSHRSCSHDSEFSSCGKDCLKRFVLVFSRRPLVFVDDRPEPLLYDIVSGTKTTTVNVPSPSKLLNPVH